MIVTVCNEKGGVGKSTIAENVAVRLAQTGKPTLLIDSDPQGTSHTWSMHRKKHRPNAPKIDCERITGNLIEAVHDRAKCYQHIVIDCGGSDSEALRSSLLVAHRALIPTEVKRRDLSVTAQTWSLVETANERRSKPLKARVVLNKCNPLPSSWSRIDEACEALRFKGVQIAQHRLVSRVAYDDLEYRGGSVLDDPLEPETKKEKESREKARDEMNALLMETLKKESE